MQHDSERKNTSSNVVPATLCTCIILKVKYEFSLKALFITMQLYAGFIEINKLSVKNAHLHSLGMVWIPCLFTFLSHLWFHPFSKELMVLFPQHFIFTTAP